jgi:predicted RNA-binding protein YlxR (DUF448 family)/ribosomal protein L30E
MKHRPERTCIGCRGAFPKDEVVRIVGGPQGAVLDYREKLPGRAAYVCVNRDCIERALSRDQLGRSLRSRVTAPDLEQFVTALRAAIRDRIVALIAMAVKAGKAAAGLSAVEDALTKKRVELLIETRDLSSGTHDKVSAAASGDVPWVLVGLTTAELGPVLGRDLVGVIGITDKGFARSLQHESERAKRLDK